MKKRLVMAMGILAFCGMLFVPGKNAAAADAAVDQDVIHQNVFVGDMDLSGMSVPEASAKVERYVEGCFDKNITFKVGEGETTVDTQQLDLQWFNKDVANDALNVGKTGNLISRYKTLKDLDNEPYKINLKFTLDTATVKGIISGLAKDFDDDAVDAKVEHVNDSFIVTEGKPGTVVDQKASLQKIEDFFFGEWDLKDTDVELIAEHKEPKGSVEELSKIKDKLGSFSTVCGHGEGGRMQNIQTGINRINGSIVYPGEIFSADAAMAPYDAETGYALGGTYENGKVVQSYGGGICQVSSTLYNAALNAEIEIYERSEHSMLVGYVEPAKDAAIAGTWKDLKLKNNTDTPILIEGYLSNGTVFFNIYGKETRPANRQVSYISEIISSEPFETQVVPVDKPIGTVEEHDGYTGMVANLWKVVTVDGKEVSRDLVNKSVYQRVDKTIEVGVASDNPKAVEAINAAIAANTKEAVEAAVAGIEDGSLIKEEKKEEKPSAEKQSSTAASKPEQSSTQKPAQP